MMTKNRVREEENEEDGEVAQILVELPRIILFQESKRHSLNDNNKNKSSPLFLGQDDHHLVPPSDSSVKRIQSSFSSSTVSAIPMLSSSLGSLPTTASKDLKLKAHDQKNILKLTVPKSNCHSPPPPTPPLSFSFVELEAMVVLKPSSEHNKAPKKTNREECSEVPSNHISASCSEIPILPSSVNESFDANLKPPEQNSPKDYKEGRIV